MSHLKHRNLSLWHKENSNKYLCRGYPCFISSRVSADRSNGKTLIEFLTGLVIIAVLSVIALPSLKKYYRTYKFNLRVLEIEGALKWARMFAMERSVNVGICVTGSEPNTLRIYDMGMRRSLICSGFLLKRVKIEESFISLNASGGGSAFDPRGLGIFSSSVVIRRTDDLACYNFTIQPLRGYIWRKECQK